jgi:sugar phosphate isomerase/epimerase
MELKLFKTLWGFDGDYLKAVEEAVADGFDGIEGPAPADAAVCHEFAAALKEAGLAYIQEICTGGGFVPERKASVAEHLCAFEKGFAAGADLSPLLVTSMAGCDAWPEAQSIGFFRQGMAMAQAHGLTLCYETHRSRSLFNPWATQRIVEALPGIRLTADFSHWCVVCERLVDTELEVINAIAGNIHHLHARVGYDQGPQVPHPAAPEYADALAAHQRWWEIIWNGQRNRGYMLSTMTPEFGPDGYLQQLPFTRAPVADLREINRWMAKTERRHYKEWHLSRREGWHGE